MRMKLGGSIGVLASIVAGVAAASAAELPVKRHVQKAPPAVLSDPVGFPAGDDFPSDTPVKQNGDLAGDGANIKATHLGGQTLRIRGWASALAKLDHKVTPILLVYGIAGF